MANSYSKISKDGTVTIPANIRKNMALNAGDIVSLVETKNGILMKVHKADAESGEAVPNAVTYSLGELLKKCTPENLHEEIEFPKPAVTNAETVQAIDDLETRSNLETVSSIEELFEDSALYVEAESRLKNADEQEIISHQQILADLGIFESDLSDADIDISDIPELDESMLANGKIRLPKHNKKTNDDQHMQ